MLFGMLRFMVTSVSCAFNQMRQKDSQRRMIDSL